MNLSSESQVAPTGLTRYHICIFNKQEAPLGLAFSRSAAKKSVMKYIFDFIAIPQQVNV